jgi:O-antigen/teichoic acid export membrane protein
MLASDIIHAVFGTQFTDAVIVFRILIWYFFFTLLHTVFTSGLVAIGQEKSYSKIMVISALMYLCSTVLLTMKFGIVGTACAMAGSEAVTLVLMKIKFSKFVKIPVARYVLHAVPSVAIMGFVLYMTPGVHMFLAIPLGAAVYSVALFLTKAVTVKDTQELLERI